MLDQPVKARYIRFTGLTLRMVLIMQVVQNSLYWQIDAAIRTAGFSGKV